MTAADQRLPNWVYDLIVDLIDHEDHPELLFTSGGFEGTAKYEWCPCAALAKAPAEVLASARVLAEYQRQQSRTTDDNPTPANKARY